MTDKETSGDPAGPSEIPSALELVRVSGHHKLSDPPCWKVRNRFASDTIHLQEKFDDLVETESVLKQIVAECTKNKLRAVVIGGWIRDQLLSARGSPNRPHDIDLVVDTDSSRDLEHLLPPPTRRTLLGGFTFCGKDLDVDAWALGDTLLIKHFGLASTFSNVLAVTDFNINAILFYPRQLWHDWRVEDGGSSSSIYTREIDFHFEWVAMPIVQVARLLHFSVKTKFDLSVDARRFIRATCTNAHRRDDVIQNLDRYCPSEYLSGAKALLLEISATARTRFFSNCLGVFEGGGVRAAAFAGAYAAACEAGIFFTKISGTSGGALAAAFIATGADPKTIKRLLFDANLLALADRLDGSLRLARKGHLFWRTLRLVTWGRLKKALTLDLFGGLYTSKNLGNWIDGALHELLSSRGQNIGARPVTFADLPIPLFVIASDVTNNKPRIWSKESTPDAHVGYAVRCSCTIPFFYQPVTGDDAIVYLDGGMISNSPTFVFRAEEGNDRGRYSARVLAFRLTQRGMTRTAVLSSFDAFTRAVADTVIDGGTHLQHDLQPGIYAVDIDTGDIGSTDFDKVGIEEKATLYSQGRRAVADFVHEERDKLYAVNAPTLYVGRDQQMLLLVTALSECEREVILSDKSSHWLYLIFPAFLAAAKRGIRIRYITSAILDRDEVYRQKLLRGLGAQIIAVNSISFRGFIVDPTLTSALAGITHTSSGDDAFETELTKVYSNAADQYVVRQLYAELIRNLGSAGEPNAMKPAQYEPCPESKLFERLRTVSQYSEAKLSLGEVSIDDRLHALQTHVREFKYLQIDWLVADFLARKIDLFQPQEVLLDGGVRTIITPPVVEACGNKIVLIEGHTRAFHCMRHDRYSFLAVIVNDVESALPAKTRKFTDLSFASRTVDRSTQFTQLDQRLWRDIEQRMHPPADGDAAEAG